MTSYQSFLKAIFGSAYARHAPYIYGLNLYCLFVITLTISLCVYSLFGFKDICDETFQQRVHRLRVKYATARRAGYD